MLQPPLITLTTDFGWKDIYVGVMKGVLHTLVPHVRLVDLTHEITPQNILEASLRLETAIDYFPIGTVHLAVVDPGVGSARDACIVQTATAWYVAPDNGLLTLPLQRQQAVRAVRLTAKAAPYFRQPLSATFHGRDVFAPVAAYLATGLPMETFGDVVDPETLLRLDLPEPEAGFDTNGRPYLRLHILYCDHFGNLITDLERTFWEKWRERTAKPGHAMEIHLQAGDRRWQGIVRTFADVAVGEPAAYWGSSGHLEIALRNGNAAEALKLTTGDTLSIDVIDL